MKGFRWIVYLIIFCLASVSFAQNQDKKIEQMTSFFVGTWKMEGKESYEIWEKSSSSGLKGKSFKVKDGKENVSETLEIKEIDGKMYYLATVLNQNDSAAIRFALAISKADEFVFENPEHDFPKKIVYKKLSETEMFVNVTGEGGKGFSFKMNKLQAQTAKNKIIKILQSDAVTIDGKIEETEWKDASVFELSGGGKVYFKHNGEYLFVGVHGIKNGWSHLYLKQGENSGIAVLHASAALGMTLYNQDKNKLWQPSNPFSWDLRDTTITTETNKKMADYLAKNFWVANNNNLGNPTEIEFQVKPRNPSDKALYVAIVYAADAKNPQYFPATLKDDTLKEDLIYGNTPNDLKFDRNQWAKIILERIKTKK